METSGKILILVGGIILCLLMWINRDQYAIPKMGESAGPIDMSQWEPPTMTADEWEKACNPSYAHKSFPGEKVPVGSRCTIQVVVDCPPDCGVYKILREDKLLRRVW